MTERVKLHEARVSVRWGDMDAAGVVNNTAYFRYVEDVRISWFQEIGYPLDMRLTGPVVVTASMDFLQAISFPCDLVIHMYADAPGASSVKTYYELYCIKTQAKMAEGSAVIVWVDFEAKKSIPIPLKVMSHLVT